MMDSEQGRTADIKQTRREILDVLNTMFAIGPFSFEAICSALVHLELPDDECVKRDLTYLCEEKKAYVKWTNERPMLRWAKRMYRLTAKGNEFVENMISDPALEP